MVADFLLGADQLKGFVALLRIQNRPVSTGLASVGIAPGRDSPQRQARDRAWLRVQ